MLKLLAVALALAATAEMATAEGQDPPVTVVGIMCLMPGAESATQIPATSQGINKAVAECHENGGRVTSIDLIMTTRRQ
jgi:hypothetical protein